MFVHNHGSVFPGHLEDVPDNLRAVGAASAVREQVLDLGTLAFGLLVKEPLINLNPLKSRHLHCLASDFSCHLPFVLFEYFGQQLQLAF